MSELIVSYGTKFNSRQKVVDCAKSKIGTPYETLDCSGLTRSCLQKSCDKVKVNPNRTNKSNLFILLINKDLIIIYI